MENISEPGQDIKDNLTELYLDPDLLMTFKANVNFVTIPNNFDIEKWI
jgi:hypothetical protein